MIIYDFIEQRLDQLLDNPEHGVRDADHMVDTLLDKNATEFKQVDHEVDAICLELWRELDAVVNEDIPF